MNSKKQIPVNVCNNVEEDLVNFLHTATAYECECVGVALIVFNTLHTEVIYMFQLTMWKLQAISVVILKVKVDKVLASPKPYQWLDLCTQHVTRLD